MKISTALLLVAGSLSIAAAVPASAEIVRKTVIVRGGPHYGQRFVRRPPPSRRVVVVKKIYR